MGSLDGRVAVVTGGTKGLGLAISRTLREAGATVVAASRYAEEHDGLISETVDVTHPGSVAALMRITADQVGGPHIVVANAGVSRNGRLASIEPDDWQATLDTNLSGTANTIRAALPYMRTLGGGRIITVSSCMAAHPPAGAGAYAVSKSGIETLTRMFALENGRHGILVNCVAPGILDTGLGNGVTQDAELWEQYRNHLVLGRVGTGEEIGRVVAFLAGPDSTYINGATIAADGGLALWK